MLASIRTALAGRYMLEREVGRGATAVVYAARDLKHGRRVALKVIEADVVSPLGTKRFLQEIRTTAGLNHPHILPLFESGDADGFIYYTMPLVQGESLRQHIEQHGTMHLHAVQPLITQIAGALSYAHSMGIVHRDLKPENILIGEHRHVWVADFGMARALASAVSHRLTGIAMAVGSPQYMSPEQAAGEVDVDGRSDIYSLGCIAFELLCGEPPFAADSVPSLLARHMSEPAPAIRDRLPDLQPETDAALRRAMAKDRTHRFRDASEFAAALHAPRARRQDDTVAVPDSSRPPTRQAIVGSSAGSAPASTVHPPVAHARPPGIIAKLILSLRRLLRDLKRLFLVGRPPVAPSTADPAAAAEPPAPPAEKAPPTWHPAALPTAATGFVGRADELRELRELLCDSPARLVTVTGPGGVGKTRLALHWAEHVGRTFRHGVAYAALSGLASPDLLVPAIAESLRLQLSRREDPLAELQAFLREKELLIVLDNFEHLTNAAGLLATLLDDAPALRLLVTSRERLNLQHETLVALHGLTLSDDDEGDAVKLFIAGARRLDRHFQIDAGNRAQIAQICALVDGIPLAIELASAWIRTLSCAEILVELQRDLDVLASQAPDLEKRHHSLRATFDASWRLLSAQEQAVLARLAVFRSAFDRAAAAQVADASAALLRQLVDKSLVTRSGDRLLMLDVVRTYALDRLAADPAVERHARERHLACFTALLHSLQSSVQRSEPAAIHQIADSIDDVRAAWNYGMQTANAAALLRAMNGLFHFYEARGWAREGADTFARSSAAIGEVGRGRDVPQPVRLAAAQLEVRHGVFLYRLGDLQSAESLLRRGAAAARELDDSTEIAFALHRLGAVRHALGDYEESERLHREAWALARGMNDRLAVGWSMTYLGTVAWSRGELEDATRLCTDALELLREEHDLNGMWVTLNNLGVLAASRQQYDEAQRRFREALALQADLNNPRSSAHVLHNLGCAARDAGEFARARQWLQEALEISDRMGYQSMAGLTLVGLAELSILEDDAAGGMAPLHRALRIAGAARIDPLALQALLTLAKLRLRQGDPHGAAELAAVIAAHPGSDGDVRRKTAELFEEIGSERRPPMNVADLGTLIDNIVSAGSGTPTTAPDVPQDHTSHAQPAGDI